MRRVALIVAMLAVVSISGLPAHAVAQAPTPTLTLEEYCPVIEGQQYYGALASLSGFRRTLPLGGNSRSAPRASARDRLRRTSSETSDRLALPVQTEVSGRPTSR
jgi:hypothetical protein